MLLALGAEPGVFILGHIDPQGFRRAAKRTHHSEPPRVSGERDDAEVNSS